MNLPEDLFLSGEYTWIRPEGEYAVVGLNEYILYDHIEVCSVELPEPGEEVEADGHFCSVETLNGYVEVYAPVSGQIMEINDEVYEEPDLINFDPYGPGWLAVIAVEDDLDAESLRVQSHWWQETRKGKGDHRGKREAHEPVHGGLENIPDENISGWNGCEGEGSACGLPAYPMNSRREK